MNNQGNNWIPSKVVPTPQFGLTMPQPGGEIGNIPSPYVTPQWQFQQFALPQQGAPAAAVVYPPQKWHLAKQREMEEQKAAHEKMLKQRQFDEQRQRLKEFESRKKKGTFSADAMIQDIFSKEERSSKARTPKDHGAPGRLVGEKEKVVTTGVSTPTFQPPPHFSAPPGNPGFPIFTPGPLQPSFGPGQKMNEGGVGFHVPVASVPLPQASFGAGGYSSSDPLGQTAPSQGLPDSPQPASATGKTPLVVPSWLTDPQRLPPVYRQASDMVRSQGDWVDTTGAYLLLLRTGLSPQVLGVLWEMVNRTQPGCLRVTEFHALLALVAIAQGGQGLPSPEVFASLSNLVHPLIDHPALLPHPREGSQKPQGGNAHEPQSGHPAGGFAPGSSESHPQKGAAAASDSDDFDDFVSAAPDPPKGSEVLPPPESHPHAKRTPPSLFRNLPTLGTSPPLTQGPSLGDDDEFDDFQSAAPPAGPLPPPPVVGSAKVVPPPIPVGVPPLGGDKYAAFRDLTSMTSEGASKPEGDDGFGDFCSSAPDWGDDVMTKGGNSAPKERCGIPSPPCWGDARGVGDLLSSQPPPSLPSLAEGGSSESSNYVTANASADTSNDDDDFGDFVGPTDSSAEAGLPSGVTSPPRNPPVADLAAETQSVASLELPSLELTVNLAPPEQQQGTLVTTPRLDSAPPLLITKTDDFANDFDRQFQSLRLEEKTPAGGQYTPDPKTPLGGAPLDDIPSLGGSSLPLTDRYSVIRAEENTKGSGKPLVDAIDPRVDLWKKCLEGCQKLLAEGLSILTKLREDASLLEQVVATSQMKDYLTNLAEVWQVCRRIEASSQREGGSNPGVGKLSAAVRQLWTDLSQALGEEVHKVECFREALPPPDSDEGDDAECCNLCLSGSGEVSLVYGGRAYHPPCANLWLNVVDLTLPSLSHARPTLL